MKLRTCCLALALLFLLLSLNISGVFASWQYQFAPTAFETNLSNTMGTFKYGLLYITHTQLSGVYTDASATKTADLDLAVDLSLSPATDSAVSVYVTLYNSTNVNYYYNKTDTVSSTNENIAFTVSGIEQKDAIAPKTEKTVTVTFARKDGVSTSVTDLEAALRFHFVVNADDIGDVVAQTAVDHFADILNDTTAYTTLETAMNDRGNAFNKASSVTYIGNVAGADSSDSQTMEELFGDNFMTMDLDGDGVAEPITMMIKREDLDGNSATGDSYVYTSWGTSYTVVGTEMTLYITSQDLANVENGQEVIVWAATFTKYGADAEWTQIVPLTKGTATANNYTTGRYGDANSFNTDTWVDESGTTMDDLAKAAVQNP